MDFRLIQMHLERLILLMGIEKSEKHIELWSDKNGPIPAVGCYNTDKRFIWKCTGCDYEWEGTPQSITRKTTLLCRSCISKESEHCPGNYSNKKIDCLGKKYGSWEVIEECEGDSKKGIVYLCRCNCGNTRKIKSHHLRNKAASAKCFRCHALEKQGGIPMSREHWNQYMDNAKSRGIDFDLDISDAYNLFLKQDKRCVLTGDELVIFQSTKKFLNERANTENLASLDRIDSNRGYTIDNIQWVRKDINLMKMAFSQEHFIDLCNRVSDFSKGN